MHSGTYESFTVAGSRSNSSSPFGESGEHTADGAGERAERSGRAADRYETPEAPFGLRNHTTGDHRHEHGFEVEWR